MASLQGGRVRWIGLYEAARRQHEHALAITREAGLGHSESLRDREPATPRCPDESASTWTIRPWAHVERVMALVSRKPAAA